MDKNTLCTDPHDLIVMGEIAGAYGVKGWVHIHNYTEIPVELMEISDWMLKISDRWQPVRQTASRVHNAAVVAKLDGIEDRDQAAALKHALVAVHKDALPKAEADTYYWYELIGMHVINRQNEHLGQVITLIRSPAHDILQVAGECEKKYLIPMAASAIDRVDRDKNTVFVDWGLDWD